MTPPAYAPAYTSPRHTVVLYNWVCGDNPLSGHFLGAYSLSWIWSGVRVSVSFQKIPCLLGQLGSGPHIVGRLWSAVLYGLVPVFRFISKGTSPGGEYLPGGI